jgi:hypothetical protein
MPHQNAKSRKGAALLISLALSAALLMAGWLTIEVLSGQYVSQRLLWPLGRLLLFICIGLCVGQTIEALGWTRFLAFWVAPLFRYGRLGDRCSAAFTTAFVSGVAANAMLLEYRQAGLISRRQLYLANLVNQFPAYFLHLPTTFFIVVPLTKAAGLLYFGLTFGAVLFRTVLLLIVGHLWEPRNVSQIEDRGPLPDETAGPKGTRLWESLKTRFPQRILGVIIYVIPIYTAVFLIHAAGGFDWVRSGLAAYVTDAFIPVESLSVVILSFAAEFTSGFAAAGALLDAGVLTVKQTVLALLIGNILAFPVRAVRHQLPRYMGIFGPKTGLQLLLLGQSYRISSLIAVGWGYYILSQI